MSCRYKEHPYKQHYACFACRKAFRIPGTEPFVGQRSLASIVKCPDCAKPMSKMGRDFKAPRRSATKQWEKVRQLREAGFAFDSCGCYGPGYRPAMLREVPAFIEQAQLKASNGRRLAVRFKRRR